MESKSIKDFCAALGADVCSIASAESFSEAPEGFHPNDIMSSAKSVIVYGKQFPKGVFETNTNAPYTMVRNKLIEVVDNLSVQLSLFIEEEGYKAAPIPSSEPYEYWDADNRHGRGILSLKHSAELAGIGSIGKNTLLVNKSFGNRLWLGAVLTTAELEADPRTEELCPPSCRICLEACPQGALDGKTIDQKSCRKISAKFTDGGGMVLACNLCRKMCPFSKV